MSEDISNGHFPEYLRGEHQLQSEENKALFHAAMEGNLAKVSAALKRGGKPNFFFHPEDQKNALHVAAERGFVDVVKTLLEVGAVVNALVAKDHTTSLILASTLPDPATAAVLLRAGAQVNAENGYGNSALHEASYCCNLETCRVLVKAEANVNATNHKGSTPLHMACYGEGKDKERVALAEYLLHEGAEVNLADQRGMNPLLVACSTGRLDMARLLLKSGAEPTARDSSGRDAVEIARFYRHDDVASFFSDDRQREDNPHK